MHTDRRLSELGRIVESQQDRLFRFAYMRVGNRPDAEDIVQDVFLRLFRSGERLSHVRSLGHYLLRCVDGLKFREIAALLGIPLATAKSRYRYGIGHIRDNMDI